MNETDLPADVDRRKIANEAAKVQMAYMRKLNLIFSISLMSLAAVTLTLAVLLWQQYQGRMWVEYRQCVMLYSQGVHEPSCTIYKDHIDRNTNVKNPGGQLDGQLDQKERHPNGAFGSSTPSP